MKVENNMIDKDLRLIGKVYKRLLSRVPKRKNKSSDSKASGASRTKKAKKNSHNEYILRDDATSLRLLIMESEKRQKNVPGILWIHGGGYAGGYPEVAYISMPKLILKERACVIVSPEYRLSVEKPYPAALEDSYQALLWMKEHAEELGIRDDQIFVGGDSAGGGLAVALCIYARDKGEVNIAFQMPLYPMIDDRLETESMKDNDAPVWNAKQNEAAWKLYLEGFDKDNISKYAAPARETDYSNLPPAVTFVGSIEPFYDETIQYVKNLEAFGVHVDFEVYDGCFHAFDMMVPWAKVSKDAKGFFMKSFNNACEKHFAPQKVESKSNG